MQVNLAPQSIWRNPLHFIAFGFGSGAMPYAPGTFGTLMAVPFYILLTRVSLEWYLFILLAAIFFGFWLCTVTSRDMPVHDHPGIVWDEIVGFGLTMFAAPHGWIWIILGFILFRLFDIWKPWPISWVNTHIKNGVGIVLDDLLAAIPAWGILQGVAYMAGKSVLF